MKLRLPAGLALLFVALVAHAAADDASFLLTASAQDFPRYFPGQLANGYVSTFTSPRGTEGTLAYMVALMDHTAGDVARPAAVPGFGEIDYSTGDSAAGHFWMNQVGLSPTIFTDYAQTLDLKTATLSTRYTYRDHGRDTAIEVRSFVDQAQPHLAATELALTPAFDGTVQLSFAFNLWAPAQPRYPLAELSGDQMQYAVAAHNQQLKALPPDIPDRAALWYHGDVQVLDKGGDTRDLTLWLDGRAARGATMAEAAALSLPAGIEVVDATLYRSQYRLALNLRVKVRKGQRYVFDKYVALSRQGWGGDAQADLALARAARQQGFAALAAAHRAAWATLWRSDVVIDGDPAAQRAVHADLYYLIANTTADTAWPVGACAMTPNYLGHVFWDSDAWVFPALLLLHPERAKSLLAFRQRSLPEAQARARARGYQGAMYPWEADPETGTEQIPHFAYVLSEREIHVTADVAIAQWQYYLASGDRAWLKRQAWPVLQAVAAFWTSRASWNAAKRRYEILHVTSVDEMYNDVPNDSFTNLVAAKALRIASRAAALVGARPDPRWARIAAGLYVPFSADGAHHLDFDPSVPHDLDSWGGSALPLLALPALDLPMDAGLRARDYAYALGAITRSHHDPNSMGLAPLSIAAADAGKPADAFAWFERNLDSQVMKPPFDVRSETAGNNTGYFITASAGMLQNLIYGFTGLRLDEHGLRQAYPPILPPSWHALSLRDVSVRGRHYDITVARQGDGTVTLSRRALDGQGATATSTSP